MKNCIYLHIVFLIFCCNQLSGQSTAKFETMKSEGVAPDYFRMNSSDKTKETEIVTSPYRTRNERISEIEFYKSSNYWVNDLLGSGKVVFGNEVSEYLNKVLSNIASANGIKDKINVHPVKYGYFNAYATDLGLLFVNVGLISRVRNEAELAFILSHELAHYYRKHNLDGHLKKYKLENLKDYSKMSSYEKVVSKHSYSRSLESEADSLGFIFYKNAGYDLTAASTVFDIMINDQHLGHDFDLNSIIDFKGAVSSLDSKIIDSLSKYIISDTIEQEELSTHPDTRKRKRQIQKFAEGLNGGKLFVISESDFIKVKKISELEACRLNRMEYDYFNSFYFGLKCKNDAVGDMEHIDMTILHSLVGIFKLKVFDPVYNPRYKDFGGLSGINLNQNSDYRDIAFYFASKDFQSLLNDLTVVFNKFIDEHPESEQMKVLQNWFIDFVERELKPQNPDLNLDLQKLTVKKLDLSSNKKIYKDPVFLSIDFRKVYMLDYNKTDKENLKVIEKMKELNDKKQKYSIVSVADKSLLTVEELNRTDLLNARLEEIYSYPKEANVFPVDFYALNSFCESENTDVISTSNAVTAYIKRVKPVATVLCFYTIVLSPVAIVLMMTPEAYTYIEYKEYNLMTGKISSNKEAQKNSKLSGSIFNDLYFPKY